MWFLVTTPATTGISSLSRHDALPVYRGEYVPEGGGPTVGMPAKVSDRERQ